MYAIQQTRQDDSKSLITNPQGETLYFDTVEQAQEYLDTTAGLLVEERKLTIVQVQ